MTPPGEPVDRIELRLPGGLSSVVVGCSGGVDSLALLVVATRTDLAVTAVHVDHGLRPGSSSEAALVDGASRRFGAAFRAAAVAVSPGPNLEARARDLRLAALDSARVELGADAVLLGHTRDDQAETVVLNLLRGSGVPGLAGMPPARGPFVRPLLHVSRAETTALCASLGLSPFEDPMNDDPAHRRSWVRHTALPLLEAGAGRDLRALLARQADVVRAESELLDDLADRELAALGSRPGGESLPAAVSDLPLALARRAVRRWLAGDGVPPRFDDVEAVLTVAGGARRAVELPGGVRVERRAQVLWRVGSSASVTPHRQPAGAAEA